MSTLTGLKLEGFKSIQSLGASGLSINKINVLIGENGAGKSNLVSFFKMLNFMSTVEGGLQSWVGKEGGASSILFYGAKTTPKLEATLEFENDQSCFDYNVEMAPAAGDAIIFEAERANFKHDRSAKGYQSSTVLGGGHREPTLKDYALRNPKETITNTILAGLSSLRVFHFHDTSESAKVKETGYIGDNLVLHGDARNLAAMLLKIKQGNPDYYIRIIQMIQQVAPFFGDFVLDATDSNREKILLRWTERGSSDIFGPNQLSDGTLRFSALATLLLQPEPPGIIVIDEPELGLHPSAISVLGALVHTAAENSQIIMTTQSPRLLDTFESNDVIVTTHESIDSHGRFATKFKRLDTEKLSTWLDDYCLSDLWEKNVLGGKPSR
jgi:predicted ATPase